MREQIEFGMKACKHAKVTAWEGQKAHGNNYTRKYSACPDERCPAHKQSSLKPKVKHTVDTEIKVKSIPRK